jgi:hypothetical protein
MKERRIIKKAVKEVFHLFFSTKNLKRGKKRI